MSGRDSTPQTATWRDGLARLQAVGIDAVLLTVLILMAELLVVAFSGRRGPTGLLLTAEEILDLLHYAWAAIAGIVLALCWSISVSYTHLRAHET